MANRPKSPARAAVETCRALAADPEALSAYMSLLPPSVVHHIEIEVPGADGVWWNVTTGVERGESLFIYWFDNSKRRIAFTAEAMSSAASLLAVDGTWPTPRQLRGVLDERGYYQVPIGALPSVKRRRAGV